MRASLQRSLRGCSGPHEIRIINRIVRIEKDGLYYESDPRHVEMIAEPLKISAANSVSSPGVKSADAETETQTKSDDVPDNGAGTDEDAVNAMVGHCD